MNIDFTLFTERAKAAYHKTIITSRQCHYLLVEPQVMLITIMQEGRDMFAFILNRLSVDRMSFCCAVQESLSTLARGEHTSSIPSVNLERVFVKAIELAQMSGCHAVALEHIFWAMSAVPSSVNEIMLRFGMTSQKVKEAVFAFRGGESGALMESEIEEVHTPTLNKYAKNLIKMAEEKEIEPVFGRDSEIRRVLEILSRKTKNNPVLVGEPGTGKTAIIEGLAHRILRGDVPQDMKTLHLYELDLAAMLAGTGARGEFEERLKQVIEEVSQTSNIILFIDEIHTLIGAGTFSGAMDAANILKPALARGKLKVIGATTLDEYRTYVESDKAFERRFQKIIVQEPDEESAISIMRNIKKRFETHHRIKILDSAVVAAVRLSRRYLTERSLPDKAIDLLDEAASHMRIERSSVPRELDELTHIIRQKEVELESIKQEGRENPEIERLAHEIANFQEKENTLNAKWQNERTQFEKLQRFHDEIESVNESKEIAEHKQHFLEVVEYDRKIKDIEESIIAVSKEIEESGSPLLKTALDDTDIMEVVTVATGIPVARLKEDEAQNLLNLEATLGERVIGQKEAVAAVAKVIRRNRLGLNDENRPIGSFLFLGSTGVGKTELAKTISECLFNDRNAMVRIDMSEYQQEHSVARLFGAPPGYVGYDQGGQLTEAVRRKPYCVVLFDEIEKAHPKVFEALLQVLDDGRMTDGHGRNVDFKNTIIVMTSNIGQDIIHDNLLCLDISEEKVMQATNLIMIQMKKRVAIEFINRIDEIIMFHPLSYEDIRKIVVLQLAAFKKNLKSRNVLIEFSVEAVSFLVEKSYDPEFGARPVKRAINEYIVNALSSLILKGEINKEKPIFVTSNSDKIVFSNQG